MSPESAPVGYVLKMYPRFSETFIVSEILAREAAGEQIVIYSMRPPSDPRFHPELARVQAPVIQVERPSSPRRWWGTWQRAIADESVPDHAGAAPAAADDTLAAGIARCLPDLVCAGHDDVAQAIELARLAREHGVRHLHAHFGSMATTIARLAGRIARIPYSFTLHAKDIFHEDVDPEDLRVKLRDADHAITISAYNLDHLRCRFPAETEHLHLVRNGLELERFDYLPHPRTHTPARILAVGRLVEKKGFDLLIDAAAGLLATGRDLRVDILGDGPLRAALQERIDATGIGARVQLLGARTQEEVRRALTEADVCVAPFVVAADGNADGLPTVLLEAMASGTPCIAADVTGVGEAVIDHVTGRLIRSGDVPALATAITQVLDSDEDRRRLTDAARELVCSRHDARRQARALAALLPRPAGAAPAPDPDLTAPAVPVVAPARTPATIGRKLS